MKNHVTPFFAFGLLLSLLTAGSASAQHWEYVGKAGFSPSGGKSVFQRMVIDPKTLSLYTSFSDEGQGLNAPQGTVMKFDGTKWNPIGEKPAFTPGPAQASGLCPGNGDTLYFSFADGTFNGFSRGRVMRYDGSSWDFIGDFLTAGECKSSNITVANGSVYFGSVDRGYANGALVVKRYNGSYWESVGATVPASGTAEVDWGYMAKDRHDSLWIAYTDKLDSNKITVKKFNGTDWVTVGKSFLYMSSQIGRGTGPVTGPIQLAFDYNNTPYVVYCNTYMGPPMVSVEKFDGTNWVFVGSPQFSGGVVPDARIALGPDNTPYVAFLNQGTAPNLSANVMKWDGTSWKNVDTPGFAGDIAAYPDIAVDPNGNIYDAFEDVKNNYQTSVMVYKICDVPVVKTVTSSDSMVCVGDSVLLSVTGTLNDATDWKWYSGSCDGTLLGTGTDIWVTPSDTTTYYVHGLGGCVAVSHCGDVTVNTTKSRDLGVVITVSGFDLSTTDSYSTYQWILNGNVIPGATASVYHVTENGDYTVVVSNKNGCMDTSKPYTVTNAPNSINATKLAGTISIYPNPANDLVHITAPIPVKVFLSSIEGKAIRQVDAKNNVVLSIRDLAAGMYLLRITDEQDNLIKVEKLIKAGSN